MPVHFIVEETHSTFCNRIPGDADWSEGDTITFYEDWPESAYAHQVCQSCMQVAQTSEAHDRRANILIGIDDELTQGLQELGEIFQETSEALQEEIEGRQASIEARQAIMEAEMKRMAAEIETQKTHISILTVACFALCHNQKAELIQCDPQRPVLEGILNAKMQVIPKLQRSKDGSWIMDLDAKSIDEESEDPPPTAWDRIDGPD